jgi:hypothetical protein
MLFYLTVRLHFEVSLTVAYASSILACEHISTLSKLHNTSSYCMRATPLQDHSIGN